MQVFSSGLFWQLVILTADQKRFNANAFLLALVANFVHHNLACVQISLVSDKKNPVEVSLVYHICRLSSANYEICVVELNLMAFNSEI